MKSQMESGQIDAEMDMDTAKEQLCQLLSDDLRKETVKGGKKKGRKVMNSFVILYTENDAENDAGYCLIF